MKKIGSQSPSRAKLCTMTVTLDGITPAIWRSLICPVDASLELLSVVFQEAFGWDGAHLYKFKVANKEYLCDSEMHDEEVLANKGPSASEITLTELSINKGSRFEYIYDFGDQWRLLIEVVEVREARVLEPEFGCRAGARAAPLEDCGGLPGYEDMLKAKKDKNHPRYAELSNLYDLETFDPEFFDPAEVNERIQIELLLDDEMRDLVYRIADGEFEDESEDDVDKLPDADKDARIELLLSVTFTNQMMADQPKEVLDSMQKLTELGVLEEDAFARVFSVFSDEFFEAHIGEREFNLSTYIKRLAQLPREVESEK